MGGFQNIAPILSILLEKNLLLCPYMLSELTHEFWYNAVKNGGHFFKGK